jgi:hypothetical protein
MLCAGANRSASFSNSLSLFFNNGHPPLSFCTPTLHHNGYAVVYGISIFRKSCFSTCYYSEMAGSNVGAISYAAPCWKVTVNLYPT